MEDTMYKYRMLLLIGVSCFCLKANAQLLKPLSVNYSQNKIKQKAFEQPVIMGNNVIYSIIPETYSLSQFLPACNFKCTLPKGAVFCRMEDAIYNHFNFWIKFRMGTDDKYSN